MCDSGTVIATYTSPTFSPETFDDTGTSGATYSYRACAYDTNSDLVDTKVAENVIAHQCGGTLVGGYCWYFGAQGQSCATVCASHGGYNNATDTYAGRNGTTNNCDAVVDAVTGSNKNTGQGNCTSTPNYGNGALGCCWSNQWGYGRCTGSNTTDAAAVGTVRRFCACNG